MGITEVSIQSADSDSSIKLMYLPNGSYFLLKDMLYIKVDNRGATMQCFSVKNLYTTFLNCEAYVTPVTSIEIKYSTK